MISHKHFTCRKALGRNELAHDGPSAIGQALLCGGSERHFSCREGLGCSSATQASALYRLVEDIAEMHGWVCYILVAAILHYPEGAQASRQRADVWHRNANGRHWNITGMHEWSLSEIGNVKGFV